MFLLILLVILFAYVYYFYSFYKYEVRNVAVYPRRIPILGHSYLLKRDTFELILDLGEHSLQSNGISAAYLLGPVPFYVISDPAKATAILNTCLEKMFLYKLVDPLVGNYLVSASVPVWKRNRRILDLAFKPQVLEAYMSLFNSQAVQLVQALGGKARQGCVDLTKEITRNVLETTFQTTMGMPPEGQNYVTDSYVSSLHKMFEIIVQRMQKPWLVLDSFFYLSRVRKEMKEALKEINETSTKMVAIRKSEYHERVAKKRELTPKDGNLISFLDIVIENKRYTERFTDLELRGLCNNMLLAAFDTTTYELLFTLVCIGSDQEVQRKICQEISEVVGEEETVEKEHLKKLIYLEAAIKEALRLYPVGPVISRQASSSLQLGDVTLPAGSLILVHLWAINRNKLLWGPDANQFKPDRWLKANTLPQHPNAFCSFSSGKRNCIGKHYALMHMKTTLVHILRQFRISSDHTKMQFSCHFMLKVKSGHQMTLEARH